MSQVTVSYANVRSRVSLIIIYPAMILGGILHVLWPCFERCDCCNWLFVCFTSAISQIGGKRTQKCMYGKSKEARKWKVYNTGYSQAVTHPSINPARLGLTSVIGAMWSDEKRLLTWQKKKRSYFREKIILQCQTVTTFIFRHYRWQILPWDTLHFRRTHFQSMFVNKCGIIINYCVIYFFKWIFLSKTCNIARIQSRLPVFLHSISAMIKKCNVST